MSPKREFSVFSTAVTLKIGSRSSKSNQLFVMSQLYIHENLIRNKPPVHKIFCIQETVTLKPTPMPTPTPRPTPTGSASKSVCHPFSPYFGGHNFQQSRNGLNDHKGSEKLNYTTVAYRQTF